MSRRFVSASLQYLEISSAILSVVPLTLVCWYRPTTLVTAGLLGIYNTGSSTAGVYLQGTTSTVRAITATAVATTTGSARNGVWNHCAAVFASATSRAVYLNGGFKGTNATNSTPAGLNVTAIGRTSLSTPAYINGTIAEAAIWNVALTDTEVLALAQGLIPSLVHPQSLVAYWPLKESGTSLEFDNTPHSERQYDMTVTGASPTEHPTFLRSLSKQAKRRFFTVGAVATQHPIGAFVLNTNKVVKVF